MKKSDSSYYQTKKTKETNVRTTISGPKNKMDVINNGVNIISYISCQEYDEKPREFGVSNLLINNTIRALNSTQPFIRINDIEISGTDIMNTREIISEHLVDIENIIENLLKEPFKLIELLLEFGRENINENILGINNINDLGINDLSDLTDSFGELKYELLSLICSSSEIRKTLLNVIKCFPDEIDSIFKKISVFKDYNSFFYTCVNVIEDCYFNEFEFIGNDLNSFAHTTGPDLHLPTVIYEFSKPFIEKSSNEWLFYVLYWEVLLEILKDENSDLYISFRSNINRKISSELLENLISVCDQVIKNLKHSFDSLKNEKIITK